MEFASDARNGLEEADQDLERGHGRLDALVGGRDPDRVVVELLKEVPQDPLAVQLLCYMNEAPIGPGFVREVEAFLSDTGIGHRRFGSNAAGDPLFVSKLRAGAAPRLSTVEQVQGWMRANRSAFEYTPGAQDQGYAEQPLPDRSSDPDRHEEPAEALADPFSSNDTRPRGTTV